MKASRSDFRAGKRHGFPSTVPLGDRSAAHAKAAVGELYVPPDSLRVDLSDVFGAQGRSYSRIEAAAQVSAPR